MNFDPQFVSIMAHKIPKEELLNIYKSIKMYTRKVARKSDLIQQLTYLLYSYELLFNRLQREVNPSAPEFTIDKTKLHTMTQDELYGMHTMFRKCLKYTITKQGAINNLLAFIKQIHYFIAY